MDPARLRLLLEQLFGPQTDSPLGHPITRQGAPGNGGDQFPASAYPDLVPSPFGDQNIPLVGRGLDPEWRDFIDSPRDSKNFDPGELKTGLAPDTTPDKIGGGPRVNDLSDLLPLLGMIGGPRINLPGPVLAPGPRITDPGALSIDRVKSDPILDDPTSLTKAAGPQDWLDALAQAQVRANKLGNPEAQRNAQDYVRSAGLPDLADTPYVENDVPTQQTIARLYQDSPHSPDDPAVQASYRKMSEEVSAQHRFLTDRGVTFEPFGPGEDPYQRANPDNPSAAMREDVRKNNHLYAYAGELDHPLLSPPGASPEDSANWLFRAIHDYFGHAAKGFSFGPRGEENAWLEHSKMFSPAARPAMTTETRGQNSWVNYGPNANLPVADRPFAEQKAFLLPEQYLSRADAQPPSGLQDWLQLLGR